MADVKRKQILQLLASSGSAVASQVAVRISGSREDAIARLRTLIDEGIVERRTIEGVKTYRLTPLWREKMK